jgi:glycosyltransferase involved in cell wall biosynthesis
VLSSRVGGIGDIVVEGRTGWLFPPGNDEGLRAGIRHVLVRPELIASMRPSIRRFAEEHVSPERIAAVLKRGFSAAGVG